MKKIASFLLAFALLLSVLLMSASCFVVSDLIDDFNNHPTNDLKNHPIDNFKERMEKEKNYQVSLTVYDFPYTGTVTSIIKVDGSIQYNKELETEAYMETTENGIYVYEKNDYGKWTVTRRENSSSGGSGEIESLLNSEYYEEVEGKKNKYKPKADVTFDDYEVVAITLEEDSCVIDLLIYEIYKVKMTISKLGEIKLTLPIIY